MGLIVVIRKLIVLDLLHFSIYIIRYLFRYSFLCINVIHDPLDKHNNTDNDDYWKL